MAFERRRLSTESDKSSTSTTYSNESTKNDHSTSPYEIPVNSAKKVFKKSSSISSPAELILARSKDSFIQLNRFIQCSSLPSHWRKNKSLCFTVRTTNEMEIPNNTRVVLLAGNDFNPCATLKNNISWFRGGQADFNDLRFLGASGRGKKFTLTIIIETIPPQQCTYRRAIKITVDGPRKKRQSKLKSDGNQRQKESFASDVESDNETHMTNVSMMSENNSTNISQSSSGLLLLAAVAEQIQPMDLNYSSNCLSPLASQFSHSINFSSSSILTSDDFPTRNLLFNFNPTSTDFAKVFHHPTQRLETTGNSSSSSTSSQTSTTTKPHVLCR